MGLSVPFACHHVALLTPDFLLRLDLSPESKVLGIKSRVRCRGGIQSTEAVDKAVDSA
jgi:hypothetical protein